MMAPMLARVQAVTSAAQGLPVGEQAVTMAAQGLPVGVQAVTAAAKGLLVALLVAMLFCGAGSAAAQTLKIGNNVKTVKVGEGAAVNVTKDQTVQAPARTKVRIKATSPDTASTISTFLRTRSKRIITFLSPFPAPLPSSRYR